MLEWLDQGILSSGFPSVLVSMSVTGAYVIVAVLVLRFVLLKVKAPAWARYGLWLAPLFRLLCPYAPEVSWSPVVLSSQPVAEGNIPYTFRLQTGIATLDQTVGSGETTVVPDSVSPWQVLFLLLFLVWAAGVAVQLGYALWQWISLRRKLSCAVLVEKGVYEQEGLSTALVLGLFRPKIYLPLHLTQEQKRLVLLHERAHLRHGDPFWHTLAWFTRTIHWMNPMVWVAFSISGQDMEAACDQKVLAMEGEGARSGYSSTLLSCVPQKRQSQLPLAFGESHPARRIRQVLGWKKPKVWVAAVSALVLVLLIVGFSTSRALSPENVPAGWKGVEVAFPANELGTPDPYPDFFETSFRLRLALPEGWEVRQPTQEEMAQPQSEQPTEEEINTIVGFSPLILMDQQGEKVGSLGFYPFHYYSEAGEQDPETYPLRAVYNEFLSNMFIQAYLEEGESMTAPSGTGCTTLCPIEFIATGYGGERPNASSVLKQGVLSYDFQSQGYAVLVLEPERLDQQQLKILGESLSFVTEK